MTDTELVTKVDTSLEQHKGVFLTAAAAYMKTLAQTAIRPVELWQRERWEDLGDMFVLDTAKNNYHRTFWKSELHPVAREIIGMATSGEYLQTRDQVAHALRTYWPDLRARIGEKYASLYLFRYVGVARMKLIYPPAQVVQRMGWKDPDKYDIYTSNRVIF